MLCLFVNYILLTSNIVFIYICTKDKETIQHQYISQTHKSVIIIL